MSDFGAFLERDPRRKMLAEWDKLKRGLRAGSRFLFHSRNHYNRIFGWREVWMLAPPAPATATATATASAAPPAASATAPPPAPPAAPPAPAAPAAQELTAYERQWAALGLENGGGDLSQMKPPPARKRGGEDRRPGMGPAAAATAAAAAAAAVRAPLGAAAGFQSEGAQVAPVAAPAPSSAAESEPEPLPARFASDAEPDAEAGPRPGEAYVAERHILMAKRGQRPQHWVPWEAVCENIATHKINVIFEIKLVMRK